MAEQPREQEDPRREDTPARREQSPESGTPAAAMETAGMETAPPRLVDAAAIAGPVQRGRYTIERVHAQGGLGRVNIAREARLDRQVALKEIRPDRRDFASHRRFINEAQITGKLEHPGIVPVYALDEDETGEPYYVMRLIHGRTLQEAIQAYHSRPSKLAFRGLLQHFVSVCQTVAYAHSRGVIHRDLKPSNVMIGEYGETLVVDWGLAKKISDREDHPVGCDAKQGAFDATQTGATLGTTAYMPPEQARGQWDQVGPAADVFSLGAMLYEILTNHRPFEGTTVDEILAKARATDFPRPLRVSASAPRALEAVCLKAMAAEPADRYARALHLADEVTRWLADEPVTAWREPWLVRSRRWLRRHRPVAAAAAALLLAAVPLLIVLAVVNDRARLRAEADKTEIGRQKDIAEVNARVAGEQVEERNAVLDFVRNRILSAARPKDQEGGLGRDVKLADAVKEALRFVDQGFKGRPTVEADVRSTLGTSFEYLGELALAEEQDRRALELYTASLGPNDRATLMAASNLANVYRALGRRADAIRLQDETLQLRTNYLGADDPDTLQSRNNLAVCYYEMGRYEESLRLHEETLKLLKAKRGRKHADTLVSMDNVAGCYSALGRHAQALRLYEETSGLLKETVGPDHPHTLHVLNDIANCNDALGRHDEARYLHEETRTRCQEQLGADHPETLRSTNDLANCYDGLKRHTEALKLHQDAVSGRKARLGADHPDTLRSMNDLANCYHELQRNEEAAKLHEETLALRKATLGQEHPDTLVSMHNLAVTYDSLKRHAEALALRQETLKIRKAALGPDDPATLMSMWSVVASLHALQRDDEALAMADDCLARAEGQEVHRDLHPALLEFRLRYFTQAKDAAGCRQTAEMWEKLHRTDGFSLYYAACIRALTAAAIKEDPKTPAADAARLAQLEADRAMAWLRQAVAAGYKDLATMKTDTDIDVLRDRDDFRKVMKELEGK